MFLDENWNSWPFEVKRRNAVWYGAKILPAGDRRLECINSDSDLNALVSAIVQREKELHAQRWGGDSVFEKRTKDIGALEQRYHELWMTLEETRRRAKAATWGWEYRCWGELPAETFRTFPTAQELRQPEPKTADEAGQQIAAWEARLAEIDAVSKMLSELIHFGQREPAARALTLIQRLYDGQQRLLERLEALETKFNAFGKSKAAKRGTKGN